MNRNFVTEYTTSSIRGTIRLHHWKPVTLEEIQAMFPWEGVLTIVRQYRDHN
jgi:hypothetical protein